MNVIIVGGGQVGSYLASLLLKDGHDIKVVEMREKHLRILQRDLPPGTVVPGDFTDPGVLETAGILQADVVVAVTPSDEGNLVVSTLARFEYNVKRVIARANNPKNTWLFTPLMGVDVGLSEADLMAHVVAEEMSLGDMITLLKLHQGQYSLVQKKIHPASLVAGKSLKELNLPCECVLVAVIRDDQLLIPTGSTVLQVKDEVLAISDVLQAKALADLLEPNL
ncbi:potassium channel family protein [Acetobacterium bakii]|uniref:Trk system potassium uptake protein TrkA n=1 Tax=Acetobacterium bakii TaxID=52689 RepID=A0A0L6U260_9FIRM|nr:TrkA family potassium uptake protein [Acetobacterium bakii]KNZ42601.1 potassium transporter TrkA [Acetobacterium bakii]